MAGRLRIVDAQVAEVQVRASDFDPKSIMNGLVLPSGPLNNVFHLCRPFRIWRM
jgi:hypothetical protein